MRVLSYQSQTGIIGLCQDRMAGFRDQLAEEDVISPLVDLEQRKRSGQLALLPTCNDMLSIELLERNEVNRSYQKSTHIWPMEASRKRPGVLKTGD